MQREITRSILVSQRRAVSTPTSIINRRLLNNGKIRHLAAIPQQLAVFQQQVKQQQQRTMVMVTQTKKGDETLLVDDTVEDAKNTAATTSNYNHLSKEIIVTESCLKRVQYLIQQRQQKDPNQEYYFLRVYVDAGGCSGFQYQFEIDHELDLEEGDDSEDLVIVENSETKSPIVVVDETSLEYMKGSTLDYVQEMIKSSFEIRDNPQSESACGCGSSFAMKNFESNPALD